MKTYEGFRAKNKINVEASKIFQDFASQEYIIFLYNYELIFGQIKGTNIHHRPSDGTNEFYIEVNIFDELSDDGKSWYKIDNALYKEVVN